MVFGWLMDAVFDRGKTKREQEERRLVQEERLQRQAEVLRRRREAEAEAEAERERERQAELLLSPEECEQLRKRREEEVRRVKEEREQLRQRREEEARRAREVRERYLAEQRRLREQHEAQLAEQRRLAQLEQERLQAEAEERARQHQAELNEQRRLAQRERERMRAEAAERERLRQATKRAREDEEHYLCECADDIDLYIRTRKGFDSSIPTSYTLRLDHHHLAALHEFVDETLLSSDPLRVNTEPYVLPFSRSFSPLIDASRPRMSDSHARTPIHARTYTDMASGARSSTPPTTSQFYFDYLALFTHSRHSHTALGPRHPQLTTSSTNYRRPSASLSSLLFSLSSVLSSLTLFTLLQIRGPRHPLHVQRIHPRRAREAPDSALALPHPLSRGGDTPSVRLLQVQRQRQLWSVMDECLVVGGQLAEVQKVREEGQCGTHRETLVNSPAKHTISDVLLFTVKCTSALLVGAGAHGATHGCTMHGASVPCQAHILSCLRNTDQLSRKAYYEAHMLMDQSFAPIPPPLLLLLLPFRCTRTTSTLSRGARSSHLKTQKRSALTTWRDAKSVSKRAGCAHPTCTTRRRYEEQTI
jgi:chemotaxis protein histidine kinase CheA